MNLPIRVDDRITYLIQIDRYHRGPRPAWHTFLPLDQAELYVLDDQPITRVTASQMSMLPEFLVQVYEGDLAAMGVGIDLYGWDGADRRPMRMICAAVLAGHPADIAGLKRQQNLRNSHGTWDDAQWGIVFRALVHNH